MDAWRKRWNKWIAVRLTQKSKSSWGSWLYPLAALKEVPGVKVVWCKRCLIFAELQGVPGSSTARHSCRRGRKECVFAPSVSARPHLSISPETCLPVARHGSSGHGRLTSGDLIESKNQSTAIWVLTLHLQVRSLTLQLIDPSFFRGYVKLRGCTQFGRNQSGCWKHVAGHFDELRIIIVHDFFGWVSWNDPLLKTDAKKYRKCPGSINIDEGHSEKKL